jgi:hypothetical protein
MLLRILKMPSQFSTVGIKGASAPRGSSSVRVSRLCPRDAAPRAQAGRKRRARNPSLPRFRESNSVHLLRCHFEAAAWMERRAVQTASFLAAA